jgi:hypothetical protein
MNVYEKLLTVQTKLNAPKNRQNKFGGYSYRSCEDILEAVKPLLAEVKAIILIKDAIVQIGERYYVYAQAFFYDLESKDGTCNMVSADAYAREPDEKKGADPAMVTGASSSYARKYALNALLLIDDAKDPDTNEYQVEAEAKSAKHPKPKKAEPDVLDEYVTDAQLEVLERLLKRADVEPSKFNSIYGLTVLSELPAAKYDEAVKKLETAISINEGKGK